MPWSCALRPAASAAICAAKGVDLREPLNPWLPADDHAIALPCASVIVIMVFVVVLVVIVVVVLLLWPPELQ